MNNGKRERQNNTMNTVKKHLPSLAPASLMGATLAPITPAWAGAGGINGDGDLELNIHFRFPPSSADITRAQEQIQRASALMCDATEGNRRIAKARLSAGGASEPAGDAWHFPPGVLASRHAAFRWSK